MGPPLGGSLPAGRTSDADLGIDSDTMTTDTSAMPTIDELFGPGWRDTPEMVAHRRRDDRAKRLTGWMRRIPVVGQLVWTFWFCILAEGVYQTCKPRWGAITFSFLNDGCKPTLWHTWRQVTHDHGCPYTGIYVSGAPRSLEEAQRWDGVA